MKRSILTILIAAPILIFGCAKFKAAISGNSSEHEYREGEALVGLQPGANSEKSLEGYKFEAVDKDLRIYKVKFSGDVKEQAAKLSARPGVEYAEPNYVLSITEAVPAPRDPLWLKLWAMKNYGQNSPSGAEGRETSDIQALEAWTVTKGSKSVLVGIIDTGVDYEHPDLKANMYVNEKEANGIPGVDDDGNGFADDVHGWNFISRDKAEPYHGQAGSPDPMDDNSHGTHVAGTIGGVGNNQIGVVGVNWDVQIMALKFLDKNGSGDNGDAVRAIKYAADNSVDVINASWGGGDKTKALEAALKYAESKGTIFIAAAGNDSSDNDYVDSYPANYEVDSLVSVAATDNRDRLAVFSNYGFSKVDIAAPGVDILSTVPRDPLEVGELYASYSGTSMATPHVAGAVALLLAADPSLKRNPKAIKQRLMQTVDVLPNLTAVVASGGRLNLYKLVKGITAEVSPLLASNWTEKTISVSTPSYPREKLDNTWVIEAPEGAKAIQVHLQMAGYDPGFDTAILYDENYRAIMSVPPGEVDMWLPPVLGSKIYLKFSTALVHITATEKKEYESLQPDLDCQRKQFSSSYICDVHTDTGTFANWTSDSIVFDKIRYAE